MKGPGEAAGVAAADYPAGLMRNGDRAAPGGLPVAAVVALAPRATESSLTALTPGEAAATLAANLFHRGGPEGLRPAFSALARLVTVVPCYVAELPDDLGRLADAAPRLVEAVTRR